MRFYTVWKGFSFLLLTLIFFISSCGLKERALQLENREKAVAQKERELLLWNQQLVEKSKELERREEAIDSTRKQIDSLGIYDPRITGKWQIKMECTETNCDGSAIGDTKNEVWQISYNDQQLIAKAFAGNKLTRIYSGLYKQNGLRLEDENFNEQSAIHVRLKLVRENRMEGTRTIVQQNCQIVYTLTADKSNK